MNPTLSAHEVRVGEQQTRVVQSHEVVDAYVHPERTVTETPKVPGGAGLDHRHSAPRNRHDLQPA